MSNNIIVVTEYRMSEWLVSKKEKKSVLAVSLGSETWKQIDKLQVIPFDKA